MLSNRNSARGALLGLAVGDALGTSLEFSRPEAPEYPTLAVGPQTEICGGGPFDVRPGQVTDDTQLATVLACSLRERGALDLDDLTQRYVSWLAVAFDVGSLTRTVLRGLQRGERQVAYRVWVEGGRKAAGNGSLMRCAPIALFAPDPISRLHWSLRESALTHFDPRCQLACAAFNAAIAQAVRGGSTEKLLAAAENALEQGRRMLRQSWRAERPAIDSAAADLARDLERSRRETPGLYGPQLHLLQHQGFVRVAFRLAFWHLARGSTYHQALIDVVNRGGDADTNGAIVGALLGAAQGESAIPEPWRNAVLTALQGHGNPLGTTYHPRTLLAQLD